MSKVIVITGGGVGLGRALAKRFASEGDTVVLLGRTFSKVKAVAEEIGSAAMAVPCDVGCPDSVREAFQAIAEVHPKIDVLINNAAVFEPFKVVDASDAQILSAVTTNLAGPMFCAREAIPSMNRGGLIINVTSESVDMNFPHLSVYQASKAGLERFSKSLLNELEPEGIRVCNVRAGQMFEEGKTWDVDPEARVAFAKAAIAAGINLMERPITQFASVTSIFRAVIDLPADLQIANLCLHARKAD
jgi:meso-butanediol dehydrogenase/(S,S)-butanediol dehydrogenase/diacetyl reductase